MAIKIAEENTTMENTAAKVEENTTMENTAAKVEEIKKAGAWEAFKALPWWKKVLVGTGAAALVVTGGVVIFKFKKGRKVITTVAQEVSAPAFTQVVENAAETVVENAPEIIETVTDAVTE